MGCIEVPESDCPPPEPKRRESRSAKTVTFKRRLQRAGDLACEVCGWKLPEHLNAGSEVTAVHAHHIIPKQVGGTDAPENLALLCPNHHCIAHRVGHVMRRNGTRVYLGPLTREALFEELRIAEDPAAREERARRVLDVDLV